MGDRHMWDKVFKFGPSKIAGRLKVEVKGFLLDRYSVAKITLGCVKTELIIIIRTFIIHFIWRACPPIFERTFQKSARNLYENSLTESHQLKSILV